MQFKLNTKKHQKQEMLYKIEYTTIYDDPHIWYSSREFGENKFKSYIEACKAVREFISNYINHNNSNNIIAEYRIVECVVNTTSEVLKNFPVEI